MRWDQGRATVDGMITRGEIVHSNVSWFWLKPGIAYVRLVDFSSQATGRDMEEGLNRLPAARGGSDVVTVIRRLDHDLASDAMPPPGIRLPKAAA